ncbi:hypothetical protein AZI86_01890 [Bdellovibrio bacteriovorus]|uniref:D,D-heptose 1,7-bisphosphate phosphatase n=1 Tax=Bdellovibrio bacteriovorus TaxID=959 RepID=A0A150WN86_BDEBC|nr:HAD-IIIA family hydrolase [Bdellovibrio bacteriovorus]KYG65848.1 hypothetical protein AZI86_01890 [Bdellovibrio bacteriovorus]
MMHWERWMIETLQRGGRFIFLAEGLPDHAAQFSGTKRLSCKDLVSGQCSTLPQDMVFVFESQLNSLKSVDAILQGQRVLIGVKTPHWIEAGWVDVTIPELTSSQWQEAYDQAAKSPQKSLSDFRSSTGQPCLFLDRDDVVVKNVPYNNDPQKVVLTPGVAELINKAHAKGWWVALVTNQSGLGRAKITWEEYQRVHQQMLKLLAAQEAWIDECVWASHIEDAPHAAGDFFAGLRKPRPGMFQQVDEKLKVDRARSVMIGDSASDVIAAYHAGVGNVYLLRTERSALESEKLQKVSNLLPGISFKFLEKLEHAL